MIEHVVLDSLLYLALLPENAHSLLDIGSGSGVPGIPISIARPDVSVVMVESRRKAASFLMTAVRTLGLAGAEVVHGRAEGLIPSGRRFDAAVSRCAGNPEGILSLGASLVTPGGVVVVSGAPNPAPVEGVSVVELVNPLKRSPRHFLVRRGG